VVEASLADDPAGRAIIQELPAGTASARHRLTQHRPGLLRRRRLALQPPVPLFRLSIAARSLSHRVASPHILRRPGSLHPPQLLWRHLRIGDVHDAEQRMRPLHPSPVPAWRSDGTRNNDEWARSVPDGRPQNHSRGRCERVSPMWILDTTVERDRIAIWGPGGAVERVSYPPSFLLTLTDPAYHWELVEAPVIQPFPEDTPLHGGERRGMPQGRPDQSHRRVTDLTATGAAGRRPARPRRRARAPPTRRSARRGASRSSAARSGGARHTHGEGGSGCP